MTQSISGSLRNENRHKALAVLASLIVAIGPLPLILMGYEFTSKYLVSQGIVFFAAIARVTYLLVKFAPVFHRDLRFGFGVLVAYSLGLSGLLIWLEVFRPTNGREIAASYAFYVLSAMFLLMGLLLVFNPSYAVELNNLAIRKVGIDGGVRSRFIGKRALGASFLALGSFLAWLPHRFFQ